MANENISSRIGELRIQRNGDASVFTNFQTSWKDVPKLPLVEYNIKETDFRVKTATFTTPFYLDLTNGQYFVLISSIYHENFSGIILDVDYDEKTGLYTYQCQDWSRNLISKFNYTFNDKLYNILRMLISRGNVSETAKYAKLNDYQKYMISGLKSLDRYNQSHFPGNKYTGNPFNQKRQLIIKDTSYIEAIRSLVFNSLGYFDVWFNDKGVLQIEPLSKTDWENTGLHLTADDYSNRKFKFSTTNAITGVVVNNSDNAVGSLQSSKSLLDLDLRAFFGSVATSIQNPNNTTKAATTSSSSSKKTTSTKSTSTGSNNGNPFNNKSKKIIVSADSGSSGFKNSIVKLLKQDGWSVTDLGVGPGTHSASYKKLSSKYAVNLTIYNGPDPKTIDEPVTGWLKGKHEKYGVRLVQMFDSHTWTSKTGKYNKKGMYYKRHGDFKGYRVPKAWDDNYSGAKSGVLIEDLEAWYIKHHKKVCYCCDTTASAAYKQFKAGGYLKMKGKVK